MNSALREWISNLKNESNKKYDYKFHMNLKESPGDT